MRVAALYDVHGNLPALEAVLREVDSERPDLVVVGGDVVWGPMPRETLERLRSLGATATFIRGNCEREVAGRLLTGDERQDAWTSWCADQLTDEQLAFAAALPATAHAEIDGLGGTLFCHGSPRSDEEMITRDSSEQRLAAILDTVQERVVVCGHTHVQFERHVAGRRIINPGSVGMAYEGKAGVACWALFGPDVSLRRTSYEAERAAQAMRATGIPHADDFVRVAVLEPATADEATQAFEELAARQS